MISVISGSAPSKSHAMDIGGSDAPSNGVQAALDAWLRDFQGRGKSVAAIPNDGSGETSGNSTGLPEFDITLAGQNGAVMAGQGAQLLVGELPACFLPAPASEQPVFETLGFLPALSGDEPQGPACSMPVPPSQRGPLDLIVSRPLTDGGHGGDWLSVMIG